ncbi:MAG TPA: protocatechuate 3,4-dioxygenase subunit alpha [Amnibacterium sp.]|nr:protocatechuate 3,4-dioxygenase subunit alpha [Amnibacterium sp.]
MATSEPDQARVIAPERLAREEAPAGVPELVQTPSQTVGPFFGSALPFGGGPFLVSPGAPKAIRLHGSVLDGAGAAVPDALLEVWQRDAEGRVVAEPGSRRRDGGVFTGFGRAATEVDGGYEFRTVLPGPDAGGARWALVTVFARGLLHHLFTRVYFVADGESEPSDALLDRLPPERRRTLLAHPDADGAYRFDVRLQGEDETVFLDYPGPR